MILTNLKHLLLFVEHFFINIIIIENPKLDHKICRNLGAFQISRDKKD